MRLQWKIAFLFWFHYLLHFLHIFVAIDIQFWFYNGWKIHTWGLSLALIEEICINLLTPISFAILAKVAGPVTLTSLNLKFLVSYSLPIQFITISEYFIDFRIDSSSCKYKCYEDLVHSKGFLKIADRHLSRFIFC